MIQKAARMMTIETMMMTVVNKNNSIIIDNKIYQEPLLSLVVIII